MKALLLAVLFLLAPSLRPAAQVTVFPPQASLDTPDLAPPEHPATADQIREYLALSHAVETAHKLMVTTLHASRATSASYFTPGFWDDMQQAILDIDIVSPCIPAYQRYFSQEDMAATIDFYKSPAGQRLLAAQPFISSILQDVLRKAGQQAGMEVGAKHKAEIQRLMQQQKTTPSIVSPRQ